MVAASRKPERSSREWHVVDSSLLSVMLQFEDEEVAVGTPSS